MNVLSLFDGISCAYVGLQRAGIEIKNYYASEIDKNAIRVSQNRVPGRIDVGDVREIKSLPEPIDLLVGGSPCQDMSIAKKGRMGLAGQRSSLFWEYVRIKDLVNPKYFVLENVASMSKEDKATITEALGVQPIMINASLVSAQSRKRLFWTNIPNVRLPEDRGILLKDILQPDAEIDDRFIVDGKSYCLTASYSKVSQEPKDKEANHEAEKKQRTLVKTGASIRGRPNEKGEYVSQLETRDDEKANALTHSHSNKLALVYLVQDVGRRLDENGVRHDGDTNYPVVRQMEVRDGDKSRTLTSVTKDNLIFRDSKIRKLTPIECERLQGLPDNYTEGIAMTQRYKCLGNAFNVDVIAHIFKSILNPA